MFSQAQSLAGQSFILFCLAAQYTGLSLFVSQVAHQAGAQPQFLLFEATGNTATCTPPWMGASTLQGPAPLTLESLSNYNGNATENITQKTNFTFLKLLCYYPN